MAGDATECNVLADMALNDAVFLCDYLGAHHDGPHRPPAPKTREERLDRANAGFAVAKNGIGAVRKRLEEIANIVNPHGASEIGLRRVFLSLFDRLRSKTGEDMVNIRRLMTDIGVERHLIAFEDRQALGIELPARDPQSVESACRRFGISDRELRAVLVELGAIPQDEAKRRGNTLLFDVTAAAGTLSRIKDSLNLAQSASILGLHSQQLVKLCEDGLIEPFFTRPSDDLKPLRYFERSQLDGFLAMMCRYTTAF